MKLVAAAVIAGITAGGLVALHHVLVLRAAEAVQSGLQQVIDKQSQGKLVFRARDAAPDWFLGFTFVDFKIIPANSVDPIVDFSEVRFQLPLRSLWEPEPIFTLRGQGPSGSLQVAMKLDRQGFFKGFIHQIEASYSFDRFNLGPLLDYLIARYFEGSALLREASHPDFRMNGRVPLKTIKFHEFLVSGTLSYKGSPLKNAEFGVARVAATIDRAVVVAPVGKGSPTQFAFGKSSWALSTKDRVMRSKPIRLRSSDIALQVQPQIEVSSGAPQVWSTFLKLDLRPRTARGRAFAGALTDEWRCGTSGSRRSELRLLVVFQGHALGCLERP